MNGRRAQPGHARKVVAPLQAPAPHTLSVALGAGGGNGAGERSANGSERRVGGGGGPHPAPSPCPPFRALAPGILSYACSISGWWQMLRHTKWGRQSGISLTRDPGGRPRAKCLRDSAEMEGDSDPEARHFGLVSFHALLLEYLSLCISWKPMWADDSSLIV